MAEELRPLESVYIFDGQDFYRIAPSDGGFSAVSVLSDSGWVSCPCLYRSASEAASFLIRNGGVMSSLSESENKTLINVFRRFKASLIRRLRMAGKRLRKRLEGEV